MSFEPHFYAVATADNLILAMFAIVLSGPLLLPMARLVGASGLRLSIYFLQRAWEVIVEKVVEVLVILILFYVVGFPALEFTASLALDLFRG